MADDFVGGLYLGSGGFAPHYKNRRAKPHMAPADGGRCAKIDDMIDNFGKLEDKEVGMTGIQNRTSFGYTNKE